MTRPARVGINLPALHHNLQCVRSLAPNSRVMAIIKADAYGHGIVRVAKTLNDADAFGVACLEEAMQLRDAGIEHPIIMLEGPFSIDEIHEMAKHNVQGIVHHASQVEMFQRAKPEKPISVWLKVDSGMHRLGFAPEEFTSAYDNLLACDSVVNNIQLMTHLASAYDKDDALVRQQLDCFHTITDGMKAVQTIANSAAVINLPETHVDWVRPGIMLYGISPMANKTGEELGLKPVMSFTSKLIAVKSLKKNDPVGYGASWRCPEDMPVGIVAAGYGDGYPRHAVSGTPILVKGKRAALVGHASMDMMAIDLRNIPDAEVGDPVLLWGPELPVEEIAKSAGTIPYELVSSMQERLLFEEDS